MTLRLESDGGQLNHLRVVREGQEGNAGLWEVKLTNALNYTYSEGELGVACSGDEVCKRQREIDVQRFPTGCQIHCRQGKRKKNSLLTSIKFSIKNALNIQNKQNQRLKLSPKQTLKQLTENLARLWRKRSIPVATKTTNQYQFSLLVFVLMKRRLNLIFRKFLPFSCCLVEQSIQLCWLAAQIISN